MQIGASSDPAQAAVLQAEPVEHHGWRPLARITVADLIVRSGYQIGKTPVLPVFAASLGAGTLWVGLIASVSTITGMLSKPLFGFLSDHNGRKLWLLIGAVVFAGFPFLYWLVDTPEHLMVARLGHGFATAIFGPASLAYVMSLSGTRRAEYLGWFGCSRSVSYVVGPVLGGLLIANFDAAFVFTLIGIISTAALIPLLSLPDVGLSPRTAEAPKWSKRAKASFHALIASPALLMLAVFEALLFVSLYALRAFLPIAALEAGQPIEIVGLFFGIQEGISLLLRPVTGRLADRYGRANAVLLGTFLICIALLFVPGVASAFLLLPLAALLGLGLAFVTPSFQAILGDQVGIQHAGIAMGAAGSFRNAGKVCGPLLGAWLISILGFQMTLVIMALLPIPMMLVIYLKQGRR